MAEIHSPTGMKLRIMERPTRISNPNINVDRKAVTCTKHLRIFTFIFHNYFNRNAEF